MNNVYALAFKIVFKKGNNSEDTSITSNSFETDSLDGSSGAGYFENQNKIIAEKSKKFECINFKAFLEDEKNHFKLKNEKENGIVNKEDDDESFIQNSLEKPMKINSIKVRIIGDLDDEVNIRFSFFN